MYQLRNVINRTSVPSDPSCNMKAAEDYLLLLLHAHVIAAVKHILSSTPNISFENLVQSIVDLVVFPRTTDTQCETQYNDKVHCYAVELLSLSLMWHGFHDACKEADGERILRYWKFLLVAFKSTNHRNYAKEAVNFLLQYYYLFSERQKHQFLWNRCINTTGRKGGNIPCDLYMEHLNRRLKSMLMHMGANVNDKMISKAGRCLAPVLHVSDQFEKLTSSSIHSDRHNALKFGKDFDTVVSVLMDQNVFKPTPNRQHEYFNFQSGLMQKLSRKELLKKVQTNIDQLC